VTDNARYVVAFVLLPVVPALAVFLPSGLVVDRIVVGVIVAILVSALSARLALTDGKGWETAAIYSILTAAFSLAAAFMVIALQFVVLCNGGSPDC
jgi:hypothetical protein